MNFVKSVFENKMEELPFHEQVSEISEEVMKGAPKYIKESIGDLRVFSKGTPCYIYANKLIANL